MLRIIKIILGLTIALVGIACIPLGVYTAIVTMLVGGICDIINQIKAPVTQAPAVAWGIVKIIFFEIPLVAGIWGGFLLAGGGITLAVSGKPKKYSFRLR